MNLNSETVAKVDAQAEQFMNTLLNEDVQSSAFKEKLDKSFQVGRKEIAAATAISNSFLSANFVGEIDTPAYKAISQMRELFDELNPSKEGDLLGTRKLLGMIPMGSKLKGYLRRYQSAQTQLDAVQTHMVQAQDEVSRNVVELELIQVDLWANMEKLQAVITFIEKVDSQLEKSIADIKTKDANRARALDQEVLYYFRQNLMDVQAALALTINAYNVAGELRKTGREVINGCDRMATLGRAALTVAVTMARATGVQIQVMKMLNESKQTIDSLILATSDQLMDHTKAVADFSSNPMAGVQTLTTMFDKTFEAMESYEKFRSEALVVMKDNYTLLAPKVAEQLQRIAASKSAQKGDEVKEAASKASTAPEGSAVIDI